MKLKLAHDFSLPIDATTQTFAILAKRGVGKTHNASVMAEEMLKAGQQVVSIDPTGAWWGLRSGYPVVIFGGEHADVPLEDGAGEVIAQAIVEGRISAVIDTSLFRKNAQKRFLINFLETIYRLNRSAVHLFVDEADDVCPQKPYGDEAQLVGALEDVVKRGRKKGIGCSLITQRPAALNKDVLTQCEILVAMRLLHPLDIKAIKEWVNVHADPDLAETMIKSLPSLPIGEAWFWAPGWGDIFQRVKVRRRETFDSSSTPKPGEKATAPKSLKEIDLEALGAQIKATVQRAKENDPATLKRRIRELEAKAVKQATVVTTKLAQPVRAKEQATKLAELKSSLSQHRRALEAAMKIIVKIKAVDFRVDTEGGQKALEEAIAAAVKSATVPLEKRITSLAGRVEGIKTEAGKAEAAIAALLNEQIDLTVLVEKREPYQVTPAMAPSAPRVSNGVMKTGGQRRMLNVLARFPDGCTRKKLAILAGLSPNSGSYSTYLAKLRSDGFMEGEPDRLAITPAGLSELGSVDPLPEGEALFEYWCQEVGGGMERMLRALRNGPLSRADLAAAAGMSAESGSFSTYLARLRTLELIQGRTEIQLSEELVG